MKKLYQKFLLWHYRRLLRKYFLVYLRKGLSVNQAVWQSHEIVAWLKFFRDLKSVSQVDAFVNDLDSAASNSQQLSASERQEERPEQ